MKLLQRLNVMNQLKKLIISILQILGIQLKKLTVTQKPIKLKRIINYQDHDTYITTQEFNKLTSENFSARFAQAN